MRILYVFAHRNYRLAHRFLGTATRLGHEVVLCDLDGPGRGSPRLDGFDAIYVRSIGRNVGPVAILRATVEEYPHIALVCDERRSKMEQAGILTDLAPPTNRFRFNGNEGMPPFPFVLKASKGGRKGQQTWLITGQDRLARIARRKGLIWQPYIANDGDWRLMVVGGRALPSCYKRGPKQGGFTMNDSEGKSKRWKTPARLVALAEEACARLGATIAGVDIIDGPDRSYVLEVNQAPEFDVFERRTKIDVVAAIIEYLEALHEQKSEAALA